VIAPHIDPGIGVACARCTKGLLDGDRIYVQLPPERVTNEVIHLYVIEHGFWIEGPANAATFSVPVGRAIQWNKLVPFPPGEVTLSPTATGEEIE
jgi:hypothetical protein